MTSSNGSSHLAGPADGASSESERSLTPEVIRHHVRTRVMRRHTFNAVDKMDEHFNIFQRHHNDQNGHPGRHFHNEFNWQLPTRMPSRKINSLIRICVSGEEFITTKETILRLEDSRLASMLQDDRYYNSEIGMYFFDRSPEVFRAVLECHRHGTLHLPGHLCGNELDKELKFWGISMDRVAKCCVNKITVGRAEAEVYKNVEYEFSSEFEDLLIESFRESGLKSLKLKTYLFLEYPSYSKLASYWSTFFATLIIISTLNVALMSHEAGREKKPGADKLMDNEMVHLVNTSKWKKLWNTEVDHRLYFFDLALVTLFTLEMVIRFATGPNKLLFFKSWINVVDLATLIMYWVKFLLSIVIKHIEQGEDKMRMEIAVFLFTEFQFLRMFRILKLARNFTGLRVLILVLKNSRHELVTLVVFIIVGMFFFSFVIYVVEIYRKGTFNSVPLAFWWSIVTMTTVGYGDFYPTGAPGMVVGALCAVAGMIISGLSIPILSNNFNVYYNTLEYQLRVQEERIDELKMLENDIKHANKLDDIDGNRTVEHNGKLPINLMDEEANYHHESAMPVDGDVVYKAMSDPTSDKMNEQLPNVEFRTEVRRSLRSNKSNHYDVIDVKPIPECVDEFTEDHEVTKILNSNNDIPHEEDSVIDIDSIELSDNEEEIGNHLPETADTQNNITHIDDVIKDEENIYAEPCWQSPAQATEGEPIMDNEMADYAEITKEHPETIQTTNLNDTPQNDVENADESLEEVDIPQPPMPNISQDVFVNNSSDKSDLIESDSETREFII